MGVRLYRLGGRWLVYYEGEVLRERAIRRSTEQARMLRTAPIQSQDPRDSKIQRSSN